MQPTFWEKIRLAFYYNDAIWHNVFLTIIYVISAFSVLALLRLLGRQITRKRNDPYTTSESSRKSGSNIFMTWGAITLPLLGFPVALFLILSITLGSAGNAKVEPGVLSYEQNGTNTSVMIVTKYIANSTGQGITTGSSKSYVYAIDTDQGAKLWKTKIGRAYSPFLFGQTKDRIVLFDGSQPVILNKTDGKRIADAASLSVSDTPLKGQFPKEAQRYAWDESNQQLLFQGLDGGVYRLDPNTLTGQADSSNTLAKLLEQNADKQSQRDARIGLISSGQKDGLYRLLLNEEDAQQLREGTYGADPFASPTVEDVRLRLYKGSLLRQGSPEAADLETLSDLVFLKGNFLSDWRSNLEKASDPYKVSDFAGQEESDTARELLRLNSSSQAPFHYVDQSNGHDIFVIQHDAVLAGDSTKLLSAVDLTDAKRLWNVDTKLQLIDNYSESEDTLTLIGQTSGNSYLFTVSLQDGESLGYDFEYDRSLKF
ncbi:PA2928 family protein [Saccharibacillus sp. JS10]|uniref:PA2928 family protein n=1 Tax=Saccharibacillus sp. JS10 TaxID=2950552 RepID=UPI00210ABA3E|nr:PA2928 family protein [Saccharibacillus sp. JS10]MCQ4088755.1 hypothetical protein [Saccharibacillus sp. JS10]